jgi:hypothetical protein
MTTNISIRRKYFNYMWNQSTDMRHAPIGRIPSPTGDFSQGIRVRGRWRRWATTALVRRGRWKGRRRRATVLARYCSRATVPARYCSREQEAAAGGLGLALEAGNL